MIYPAAQGRPYTEQEIANSVGMSSSQVSNLRNGRSVPRADRAVALAKLFGVRVEYFFSTDDDQYVCDVEEQLRAIERQRHGAPQTQGNRMAGRSVGEESLLDDEQVRSIAEGVAGLPRDMRDAVGALVDHFRRSVGLPTQDFNRRSQ
ncbi:helix-turn-helix transcriptional regulator [Streptomyces sparsogenes]|uniref:helix-turn-helix transcriptional regulator n=1 Tax=Streptomyces sparsogenes TaxID=67365 RepID=UPI00384EBD32